MKELSVGAQLAAWKRIRQAWRGALSATDSVVGPPRCFAISSCEANRPKAARCHAASPGSGIVSASVASLIQKALRVDGSFIFLPLCFSLFLLVLKFGPDGWRYAHLGPRAHSLGRPPTRSIPTTPDGCGRSPSFRLQRRCQPTRSDLARDKSELTRAGQDLHL